MTHDTNQEDSPPQGKDAHEPLAGSLLHVRLGSSKGRSVRAHTDGIKQFEKIEREGVTGLEGTISQWSVVGIIFGTKTGKPCGDDYRFFELVPSDTTERLHLDDMYWIEGFFEVKARHYGVKKAHQAFKTFKARGHQVHH